MEENTSILKRLAKIKLLAREYFLLEKGSLISKHGELLYILNIRGQNCTKHPHREYMVCISRKALKHSVESRARELKVRHSKEESLAIIYFAIDKIPDVILNYDLYEEKPKDAPPKHFYSKDYSREGKPSVRILVEEKKMTLEIRSIHFQTRSARR